MTAKVIMPVRLNPVEPLGHKLTAMHATDTAGQFGLWSGAVTGPISTRFQPGDEGSAAQPGRCWPAFGKGLPCPYGQPGDLLWVREAWRTQARLDGSPPRDLDPEHQIWYEADAPCQPGAGKYRPPMFMPRWVSRGLDEITNVRVERLQDIGEADCIAEGVVKGPDHYAPPVDEKLKAYYDTSARRAYRKIWESINGPGSWAANPWVWVIEFKVLQK